MTAVTIPTWITATSQLSFSGSAGRTSLLRASRHIKNTYSSATGSTRPTGRVGPRLTLAAAQLAVAGMSARDDGHECG